MLRSKLGPVFAVLLALTLFFGGMLSYKILAGGGGVKAAGSAQKASARSDAIGIQGKVAIRVYSASGQLKATWNGHNSLFATPKSAIAGCLSGITSAPHPYGSCSGAKINVIEICNGNSSICPQDTATNTMLPSGCDPAVSENCTGWESTATIDITTSALYTTVIGEAFIPLGGNTRGFDLVPIPTALTLNPGDRAVVTITFTVT